VPVDWRQYRKFHTAGISSPLLSELTRLDTEAARPVGRGNQRRDGLLAAEPAERRQTLQSYLSEQVARVLGLSPSKLDLQQPLSNLGMDSLMAVELKNRIALDLGVNVPVAKFLQGFSVDEAITQVLAQLAAEVADPATPVVPAIAQTGDQRNAELLLANLDQLSDEQVGAMLTDMLGEENDRPASL
jgi:phthiocerol/phenolphthiocerol synthesis type-I polyketide synthase D